MSHYEKHKQKLHLNAWYVIVYPSPLYINLHHLGAKSLQSNWET